MSRLKCRPKTFVWLVWFILCLTSVLLPVVAESDKSEPVSEECDTIALQECLVNVYQAYSLCGENDIECQCATVQDTREECFKHCPSNPDFAAIQQFFTRQCAAVHRIEAQAFESVRFAGDSQFQHRDDVEAFPFPGTDLDFEQDITEMDPDELLPKSKSEGNTDIPPDQPLETLEPLKPLKPDTQNQKEQDQEPFELPTGRDFAEDNTIPDEEDIDHETDSFDLPVAQPLPKERPYKPKSDRKKNYNIDDYETELPTHDIKHRVENDHPRGGRSRASRNPNKGDRRTRHRGKNNVKHRQKTKGNYGEGIPGYRQEDGPLPRPRKGRYPLQEPEEYPRYPEDPDTIVEPEPEPELGPEYELEPGDDFEPGQEPEVRLEPGYRGRQREYLETGDRHYGPVIERPMDEEQANIESPADETVEFQPLPHSDPRRRQSLAPEGRRKFPRPSGRKPRVRPPPPPKEHKGSEMPTSDQEEDDTEAEVGLPGPVQPVPAPNPGNDDAPQYPFNPTPIDPGRDYNVDEHGRFYPGEKPQEVDSDENTDEEDDNKVRESDEDDEDDAEEEDDDDDDDDEEDNEDNDGAPPRKRKSVFERVRDTVLGPGGMFWGSNADENDEVAEAQAQAEVQVQVQAQVPVAVEGMSRDATEESIESSSSSSSNNHTATVTASPVSPASSTDESAHPNPEIRKSKELESRRNMEMKSKLREIRNRPSTTTSATASHKGSASNKTQHGISDSYSSGSTLKFITSITLIPVGILLLLFDVPGVVWAVYSGVVAIAVRFLYVD